MKRMRIMGLCLVAIFAMGAVAAVSASAAEPSWYECGKAAKVGKFYTGHYTDKECKTVSESNTGKYELVPGVGKNKKFKGTAGKSVLHNVIPGKGDIKVECASSKDEGLAVMPNLEAQVKATFSKCKSLGAPCATAGAKKEEIKTNSLAGELGYISKPGTVVGADLANEAEPGKGITAEFECTGVAKVRVIGSVIGVQGGDVNVINKVSTTTYAVGPYLGELAPGYTPQVNIPMFEGGPLDFLGTELNAEETGFTWQPPGGLPSGQESLATNKGEALEVKA
jgi:hypothetical protein